MKTLYIETFVFPFNNPSKKNKKQTRTRKWTYNMDCKSWSDALCFVSNPDFHKWACEGFVWVLLWVLGRTKSTWLEESFFEHFNADRTHSQFSSRKWCFLQHLQYFRLNCKLKVKQNPSLTYVSCHSKNKYYLSQSSTSLISKYTILCQNASHWLHLTFCLFHLKKFWSDLTPPVFSTHVKSFSSSLFRSGKQLPLLG